MGWSEVSPSATDIKKHKGEAYVGTYLGSKEITTKIGPQTIWQFSDPDGAPLNIYGFTNLNRAMETMQPGAVCRITYLGTENVQTKFGMKDVHQVSVEVHTKENDSDLPF